MNDSRIMFKRKSGCMDVEGVLKRCEFEGCNSDSRYSTISFISFPKPCLRVKNNLVFPTRRHIVSCPSCETCQRWIDLCLPKNGKKAIGLNDVKRNAYICSSHFVDRHPSPEFAEPLPVAQVLKIRFQRSKANNKSIDEEQTDNPGIAKHFKTTGTKACSCKEKIEEETTQTNATELVSQNDTDPCRVGSDPVELNQFLSATSKTFQEMCDELRISTIFNNNLNYVNASKERITVTTPVEEGGQSVEILIVNKTPDDTSPSFLETATELEEMVKEMKTMLSAGENEVINSTHKATQTDITSDPIISQQYNKLENDNIQLKIQVATLKNRVSYLQRELKMEKEGKHS